MLPFYFGLDLLNVTIILSVDAFSAEFFAIVLIQEVMGLCRNCGLYDIAWWLFLKVTGIKDTEFPLKSVAFLDELNTISAVDSVSETGAVLGLMSLVLGEAVVPLIDPSKEACGVFNECGEDGSPKRSVGSILLVCTTAFFFRAAFFSLERVAFKHVMRHASKIETSHEIMASSLTSLKSVVRQKSQVRSILSNNNTTTTIKVEPETSEGNATRLGVLSQTSAFSVAAPTSSEEVDSLFLKTQTLLESPNWRHTYFTKTSKIAVDAYHPPWGDTSAAAAVYAEVKNCFKN